MHGGERPTSAAARRDALERRFQPKVLRVGDRYRRRQVRALMLPSGGRPVRLQHLEARVRAWTELLTIPDRAHLVAPDARAAQSRATCASNHALRHCAQHQDPTPPATERQASHHLCHLRLLPRTERSPASASTWRGCAARLRRRLRAPEPMTPPPWQPCAQSVASAALCRGAGARQMQQDT